MALPNKILLSSSVINIEATPASASRPLSNKDINLKDWINDQITEGLIVTVSDTPTFTSVTTTDVTTDTVESNTVSVANETTGVGGSIDIKSLYIAPSSISGGNTFDLNIDFPGVPSGSMILGVSFRVVDAITTSSGTHTWSSAFTTGSTTSINTGSNGTAGVNFTKLLVPEITTSFLGVRLTAPGAETFTAGSIKVVIYYMSATQLSA